METRVCSRCKEEKLLTEEFYPSKSRVGNQWQHSCKDCQRIYQKNWLSKNKDKTVGYNKAANSKRTKKQKDRLAYMRRIYKIKTNYGITEQEVRDFMDEQKGCCIICDESLPLGLDFPQNVFAVDHCHKTGVVRGLLCRTCNSGIGYLKDDIGLLTKALLYLRRHEC